MRTKHVIALFLRVIAGDPKLALIYGIIWGDAKVKNHGGKRSGKIQRG